MEEIFDKPKFNNLVHGNDLSFLQSWEWGEVKSPTWKPIHANIDGVAVNILTREIPILGKSFGYIPRGLSMIVLEKNSEILNKLISFLSKNYSLSHLIIDPNVTDKNGDKYFEDAGFRKSGTTIQPNQTNIIDLGKTEEELFMQMSGKYRRNVKKSIREGCEVEIITSGEESIDRFYEVMTSVFARTKYIMHGLEYFRKVWKQMSEASNARIYMAKHNGKDVGTYLVIFDNTYANELYGGVTSEGRDVEASYLLKWEAIKDAQRLGKKYYDHWGIAPIIDGEYDSKSELYNISKFKEGFGGRVVTYLPQYTYVFDQKSYIAYEIANRANKLLLKAKKLFR